MDNSTELSDEEIRMVRFIITLNKEKLLQSSFDVYLLDQDDPIKLPVAHAHSQPCSPPTSGYNKGVQDRNLGSPLGAKKNPPAVTAAVGKQMKFSLFMGPERP